MGVPYSTSPRSALRVGQASLPQGEAGGGRWPGGPGAPPAAVEACAQPQGLLCCVFSRFQELGLEELLEKEEVQAGVAAANEKGDRELASKSSPGRGLSRASLAPAGWGPLTLARLCSAVLTAARSPAGGAFSVPHAACPAPAAWGTLRTSSLRPQARDSGPPLGPGQLVPFRALPARQSLHILGSQPPG